MGPSWCWARSPTSLACWCVRGSQAPLVQEECSSALSHGMAQTRDQCGPRVVISSSQTHPAPERHGHAGGARFTPLARALGVRSSWFCCSVKRRKDVRPMWWWRTRGFFRNPEMPLCGLSATETLLPPLQPEQNQTGAGWLRRSGSARPAALATKLPHAGQECEAVGCGSCVQGLT